PPPPAPGPAPPPHPYLGSFPGRAAPRLRRGPRPRPRSAAPPRARSLPSRGAGLSGPRAAPPPPPSLAQTFP
ncbi:hypothetical protein ABFP36_24290, partial [Salmonella enterica subsp. enterica serovar Kentucky]